MIILTSNLARGSFFPKHSLIKPIKILKDIPRGKQWKKNLSVMTKIYYTGFPNTAGPLSFSGHIAGFTADEYIYLDSYAWSGASGSGIFSENGKFIGYIVAIDVGATEFGAQVLENIIVRDKNILNESKCKKAIRNANKLMARNGRLLVRKSGTESKIRIMGESNDKSLILK